MHKQLLLPHSLRESVLEVAHDSILGGHLAAKKIHDRVPQISSGQKHMAT